MHMLMKHPGTAAAYLGAFTAGLATGRHGWTVHQGVEMGRPSVLYIAADVETSAGKDRVVRRTYVAGSAVMMSYGALRHLGPT